MLYLKYLNGVPFTIFAKYMYWFSLMLYLCPEFLFVTKKSKVTVEECCLYVKKIMIIIQFIYLILKKYFCIFQVIHNLSMWTAADKAISYDQVKSDAQHAKKDIKMVRLYMRDYN